MLKKLGWALFALALLAALGRASADSAGGMSILTLSNNITSALSSLSTAITTAISGSSVTTGTAGSPSAQTLTVVPPPSGYTPFLTAPQAAAPDISGAVATISSQGGTVIIPTGTLPGLGVQIGGAFTGATINAFCSQDGGTTYPAPMKFWVKGTGADTTAPSASLAAGGNFSVIPANCDHVEIVATALLSGAITVTWNQTAAFDRMGVFNWLAYPLYDQIVVNGALAGPGNPQSTDEVGSSNPAAGIVPVVSIASGTAASDGVLAKSSPGNLYDTTALNTSTTQGYLVLLNLTALPASGAAIAPIDFRPLFAASSTGPGFAEIDSKPGVSCVAGCVTAMSASLSIYTPSLTGIIQARAR